MDFSDLGLLWIAPAARSTCGIPCPQHEHACARSPRHCGPCRDVKQKGDETCAWGTP